MKKLFNKIRWYLNIKTSLNYAKRLLIDGTYIIDQRTIKMDDSKKRKLFHSFTICCKSKINEPVDSLYFVNTRYKIILITENNAYFFVKNKNRYNEFKTTYNAYESLLQYNHINVSFSDKDRVLVSNVASGVKYKNNEKFFSCLDVIFKLYEQSKYTNRNTSINGVNYQIPYFVQHGDFKDSNVFWDQDNCTMIDLEAIDYYPVFFDLFFYILISKTKFADEVLFSAEFINRVKKIWSATDNVFLLEQDYQFVDLGLALYLTFILQMYKNEHTKEFYDYYFYWVSYDFVNDYRLPLTKAIISKEVLNDKFYKRSKK